MKENKTIPRTILSLCDYSGIWSKPYRDDGYNVIQVDIDLGQDMRLLEHPGPVHGIIAQPPCTHLAASGARWWKQKGEEPLIEGLTLVDTCLRFVAMCQPDWWVLENPVGRLRKYIGEPVYRFQPHEYAALADDPKSEQYTKKTCLWGSFKIPPLAYKPNIIGSKMLQFPQSKDRARKRSMTPTGFAKAFYLANP